MNAVSTCSISNWCSTSHLIICHGRALSKRVAAKFEKDKKFVCKHIFTINGMTTFATFRWCFYAFDGIDMATPNTRWLWCGVRNFIFGAWKKQTKPEMRTSNMTPWRQNSRKKRWNEFHWLNKHHTHSHIWSVECENSVKWKRMNTPNGRRENEAKKKEEKRSIMKSKPIRSGARKPRAKS